jgi:hypothetical protein
MTATDGGPALHGADAAPVGSHARTGLTARSEAPRLRTVLALARVESSLLARSLLILVGLVAGGAAIWLTIRSAEPLWWNVGWRIGLGQLVLGMAVLVAAQLAAGRVRRNAMADLWASFPATAGIRTLGQLVGLVGAVPASLLLIGAVAVAVQLEGAIGAPSIAVLAGGLLLVIAAGAAGIAIGTRFSHPLAGVLGALALFLSSGQSHLPWAAGAWLYPWNSYSDQLGSLPGPLSGYPPAGAHALELAGLAVLAGIVALAMTVSRAEARAWGGLVTAGIVALALLSFAGVLQLRPIPTADMNHLVSEVADPTSVQRCATADQVRYCVYPGFGSLLPSLEAPVNGVLAHLPARPAQPLTIRQVVGLSLPDSTLTHGHPNREVSQWDARMRRAPGSSNVVPAPAVYLPVGSWPAAGGQLADAHFDLALAAADWAVRIPPQHIGSPASEMFLACVPLDQAREAIAIWLAILAAQPPAAELQDGLGTGAGFSADVRNSVVPIWNYPGIGSGYVTPPGGMRLTTAGGYLLAHAMTTLPELKVSHVLTHAWGNWLNWRTTDAQLAAALGIPMPRVPAFPGSRPHQPPGMTIASGPQNPVCTT